MFNTTRTENRRVSNSWQPLDNLDYGIYLKSYQVELKDWYVYEKSLDTSDAMITTYNVAHLLGERKNMGNSNNKELNCFSKTFCIFDFEYLL